MNKQEWSEWINGNVEKAAIYGPLGRYDADVVKVNSLRNRINIIPEDIELPIIPKFVAEYIEYYKDSHLSANEWFTDDGNDFDFEENTYKWLSQVDYEKECERAYLLHTAIRKGYDIEPDQTEDITEKLVNHIRSDDFEDILRSSIREFVIKNGVQ